MISKGKIRRRLIKKIENLADDKLGSVEKYINSLESEIKNKTEILSSAGIFKDLDSKTFDELTVNLHNTRLRGTSRIQ